MNQPQWPGSPRWLHGDLHPLNLAWRDGGLAVVIDFGDITAGDPASDLGRGLVLFPQPDRRRRLCRTLHALADDHG